MEVGSLAINTSSTVFKHGRRGAIYLNNKQFSLSYKSLKMRCWQQHIQHMRNHKYGFLRLQQASNISAYS